jgi:hypothetical protein
MTPSRIRIESDENVVKNAKIFYLPAEGELFDKNKKPVTEVDISRCVQGVDLHLHVGEISRATLHTILIEGHVEADVEDVILKRIKPRGSWWQRRRRDVTRFGAKAKEFA